MRIVVDTNIIFSAILNSSGHIGDILFNSGNQFEFYSSEFVVNELDKYQDKLLGHSKMTQAQVEVTISQILKEIHLISLEAIPLVFWEAAFELSKGIDEKDTPFVATTLAIEGTLWTGDRKLVTGLRKKGFRDVVLTAELIEKRK